MNAPNESLDVLMATAGISNKSLAFAMRELAKAQRIPLATTHSRVKAWRDGQRPHSKAVPLLLQALSARLGRPLDLADIGLAEPDRHPFELSPVISIAGTIEETAQLGRCTMFPTRRQALTGTLSALFAAATADALLPWSGTVASAAEAGKVNVGTNDAAAVMATARSLLLADNKLGGAAVFDAGVAFARDVATPMLSGAYTDQVGKELFAAVGYLHHTIGWAAYDRGDFEAAARYLATAQRQAKISGDPVIIAGIGTDTAHLARYCGDAKSAVRLCRAADLPGLPGAIAARNHAIEARAWASMGEVPEMKAAIGRALDALDAARPDREPQHALSGWFDHDQLASELAYAEVDAGHNDSALARTENVAASEDLPRRTAAVQAARARAYLAAGDLEAGLAAADQTLKTALPVKSIKGTWHVRAIQPALARYSGHPAAAAMADRISAVLTAAA